VGHVQVPTTPTPTPPLTGRDFQNFRRRKNGYNQ